MTPSLTPGQLFRLAFADLNGIMCRCQAPKTPGRSFCRRCYYSLPVNMRRDLYQRVGEGYEQAWTAALDFLCNAAGRIKERPEWLQPAE